MDSSDTKSLIYIIGMILLIGAGISFTITLYATILWTFRVNFVWGLIWLVVSQIVFGGGLIKVTVNK